MEEKAYDFEIVQYIVKRGEEGQDCQQWRDLRLLTGNSCRRRTMQEWSLGGAFLLKWKFIIAKEKYYIQIQY